MILWIKALHVISVIAWLAGLLYLPRLFVYHTRTTYGSELDTVLATMESRLLRVIMNPAMISTWCFGLWLLFLQPGLLGESWVAIKLVGVLTLTLLHILFAVHRRRFLLATRYEGSSSGVWRDRSYKLINEAVTICMVMIVIMVIVRPFSG